eukprot:3646337-Rhodomonas_salina.2
MTPGGASDDQSPSHPVTEAAVARWHGQSLSGRGAGSLRAAELSRARAAVTEMWTVATLRAATAVFEKFDLNGITDYAALSDYGTRTWWY